VRARSCHPCGVLSVMARRGRLAALAVLVVVGPISCSGKVGDYLTPPGARGPTGGDPDPITSGGAGACEEQRAFAPTRVWQLTDAEYVSVVRQVFGVTLDGVDVEITAAKAESGEYTNLSELSQVGAPAAKGYRAAAKKIAAQATVNLVSLLPCATATPDTACIEKFIRTKIARAYRRALADVEIKDLMNLYAAASTDSLTVGVRVVVEAALQAPSFVYRSELGTAVGDRPAAQAARLNPYEIASALSFTFLEAAPDDALWAKAQDGTLASPEILATEVDRLMALPEAQTTLRRKAAYWLGVERIPAATKDGAIFPEYTPQLQSALYESATRFVSDLVAGGTFSDVLSSRRVYVNDLLAGVYGLPGPSANGMVAVEVASGDRSAGILSQPGILAAFSRPNRGDPIHRGLFVYDHLICGVTVGSPPPGALAEAAKMTGTERELAAKRAANGVCKGCHGRFDALGLATERYDPIGRYHETDEKGLIDSTSVIGGLGIDLDGPVTGVDELAQRLLAGRRASDCGAIHLATYVLGRDFKNDKSCAVASIKDELATTGSLRSFFRALVTSPAFTTRDPNLIVE
jgi:Protein of unknown function (DUF1592)/Protein of unknown function (DUF1588)/Protein of unknown function (DUF1595)/Protein of unknown function (DUF1585)